MFPRHIAARSALIAFCALAAAGQPAGNTPPSPAATRARAWDALRARLHEEKYLNHSLAVEAIMRALAARKGANADEWGLAGLLHDIDIAETANDLTRHGTAGVQILRDLGFSDAVVHAVHAHDGRAGVARTSPLDHALYCADQVYWLIMAAGPKYPSEEFNAAAPQALWERARNLPSKKAAFAETSGECAEIGIRMPELFEIAHSALQRLVPG